MTMRSLLVAGVAAAALFTGAAFAQSTVDNTQDQTNDVLGQFTLDVVTAQSVAATAAAGGNIASVSTQHQGVVANNEQTMQGASTARATATFGNVTGSAVTTTYGFGNGFSAAAEEGSVSVSSSQSTGANAHVNSVATSTGYLNGPDAVSSTGATAAANIANVGASNGDVTAALTQTSRADVNATAEGNLSACCGSASAGAVASANNINTFGSTSTHIADTTQTSSGDSVTATSDLYVSNSAGNIVGAATANGNATTSVNEWGYLQVNAQQDNASEVTAQSWVTGDSWNAASSSAYGVGNIAVASNIGSDTRASFDQTNSGDVRGWSSVQGSGGVGVATATAIGNANTGFLCTTCGNGSLYGTSSQSNSGAVEAVGSISMPNSSTAVGAANAFGNASTFVVGRGS